MDFAHRKELIALTLLAMIGGVFLLFPSLTEAPLYVSDQKDEAAHFLIVGDIFFDRSIRQAADTNGYDFLFSCVKDRFAKYDSVVANLEGPVTKNASVSVGSIVGSPENFTFTFDSNIGYYLKKYNINIVSLGNNHIANQGRDGLLQTEHFLKTTGVHYFGGVAAIDGVPTETGEPILSIYIKGRLFSFISFNEFGGSSAESVAERITDEKTHGNTVVVFAHWGDEYAETPPRVKDWANMFVKAGADLVVGSHPHVVQGHETIDGIPVYYSLGNFIFDQFWNAQVSHGLALDVTFEKGKVTSITELQSEMRTDRRVCIGGDVPFGE